MALMALIFHWNPGVEPPLTGVAVKFTVVPSQTGFASAVIDTLTGSSGFTVMVTVLVGRGPVQVAEAFCIRR